MEAATALTRAPGDLAGEKAGRIVEAMRVSVAERGIAGSTFDHVAREAGVSRGLLHYYFGTKERLLVETVRRECDVRIERLERSIAGAGTAEDVLAALVEALESLLGDGATAAVMFYEMVALAQRNAEIAAEVGELGRRTRSHLAGALRARHEAGVVTLRGDADAIAVFLFVLADGISMRRLVERDLDSGPAIALCVAAARAMIS